MALDGGTDYQRIAGDPKDYDKGYTAYKKGC